MKTLIFLLLFQEKAIGTVISKDTIDTHNNCRFLFQIKLKDSVIQQPIYMPCDWIEGDTMIFHHYDFINKKKKK